MSDFSTVHDMHRDGQADHQSNSDATQQSLATAAQREAAQDTKVHTDHPLTKSAASAPSSPYPPADPTSSDDGTADAPHWQNRTQPAMSISSILNQHSSSSPKLETQDSPDQSSTSTTWRRQPALPKKEPPFTLTDAHNYVPASTHGSNASVNDGASYPLRTPNGGGLSLPSLSRSIPAVHSTAADDGYSTIDEDTRDSDLSADENKPIWQDELTAYLDQRAAHQHSIEKAWKEWNDEKQFQVSRRICQTYETQFQARKQKRTTRPSKRVSVVRRNDQEDIDLELLDTLAERPKRLESSPSLSMDALEAEIEAPSDTNRSVSVVSDDETELKPPPTLIDPESGEVRGIIPIGERRAALLNEAHQRVWTLIAKRDIPKVYRTVMASYTNKAMYWRRLSSVVQREAKRGAARNNKSSKDTQLRSRKVMRELLLYWKRNEREERDLRKKAEKEALDKAKKEEEMREAKRQARKLNFLITQTELYSHFVGNKLKTSEAEESEDTASAAPNQTSAMQVDVPQANGNESLQEIDFDDEDESNMRAHAAKNANDAVQAARDKAQAFDAAVADERRKQEESQAAKDPTQTFDSDDLNFLNPTSMGMTEVRQPKMLNCTLKPYQLKGLSWLANLYEQGINGILADEMGLGKTVQSIALMAYLAEVHDIWGPFLVIAPASTLHNWQQEITKFVPGLKALPYWGNVKDRAVLRKFWNRRQISYDRNAPFHVLVTSYQLVVSDEKYFQRLKWQYMVLDEAQAIKSSSSNRWKTLLGFSCRNRLLLTGTPVQNSMQELWALLHFIMPSLFDSHDEFSEWFSKDIENHAENKGTLNEHQLRRLHMILKPFMLRRIKKNVQNELGDKIEVDLYCDLSARQKLLYNNLRSHVSVAELVDKATSTNDESGLKSLMNLVMQFRKVCNHPELFERADVRAPFLCGSFAKTPSFIREGDQFWCPDSCRSLLDVQVPQQLVKEGLADVPTSTNRAGFDSHYLDSLMNIWRTPHIVEASKQPDNSFAFLSLLRLQPSDAENAFHGDAVQQLLRVAAHDNWRRQNERLVFDEDFVASTLRPSGWVRRHVPYATYRPAADLVPLECIPAHLSNDRLGDSVLRAAIPAAVAPRIRMHSNYRPFVEKEHQKVHHIGMEQALFGLPPTACEDLAEVQAMQRRLPAVPPKGFVANSTKMQLWKSPMQVPQMNKLIVDSSKLARLDALLSELKANGHRVLIYFQMTKMIDLMEEYLIYRQYKYLRLDGASKISDRRDMVTDWQTRPDLFVFLLSTRAGGLGINLTAADTVIFYDHDWNPSNDSQAMDRAHRLGQTKQVTVYRLITKGTIDERIVKLARNKKEVQDIVVGNKAYSESGMAKPQEIVSLLLDDDELADSMLRRKQADEAQLAIDKAENARAMHAKRKLNKAESQAKPTETALPSVNWTLEDDEDDFFGAKPPPPKLDDTPDGTPQPKKRAKTKADGDPNSAPKRPRKRKSSAAHEPAHPTETEVQ
ncbi:Putative DNA helicase ino80 [Malassezia psittaci]|uniref:Chromatin-remodeling ATPase INO80 n=1 Tax=Malassezia psittaci TaxID=1821823 RepID=A0AAF0FD73_9BASI|nr:Putative DNA helicase ino80 [Malassezia psittaci]